MKPQGPLVAERVAAQHCPELLRGTHQAGDCLKQLAELGERLTGLLERRLSALCANASVTVKPGEPAQIPAGPANEKRGEPVLNSTIAFGSKEVTMIASLPCRAALSFVDLALGGNGKDCAMATGKMPLSAQLAFERFEKMLISVLAQALELSGEESIKLKSAGGPA